MVIAARMSVIGRALGAAGVLAVAVASSAQSLDSRLRTILNDPKLGEAKTGVVIMDASSGRVLASNRPDDSFIPASNMKLLTSGAALAVLGDSFVFETVVRFEPSHREAAAGPGMAAVTGGRVVLVGAGDPALADPVLLLKEKASVETVLDQWTSAMKTAGVPEGVELVIDDRVFDRQYVHPSWPAEQLNRWYCAEVAGLNFHTNLLSIYAQPQEPGRPPAIKTEPLSPWLEVRNRGRSVRTGNHTAWASRDEQNNLTLHGDVRFANEAVEVALTDIPSYMGRLLADRMAEAGMRPARVRLAGADEDLSKGRVLHSMKTDLDTVLRRCNVDSYNLYAEAILKRMGHEVTHSPGSWANGAAVLRMVLQEKLGLDAGQAFTVADGSGMSRNNRVTPRMLARWLEEMVRDEKLAKPFLDSLPEAGAEGTLRKRFRGGPLKNDVRAKTGYLSGVSAISGYVTDPSSERRIIFAIITNDKPNKVQLSAVREAEEKIIRMIDTHLNGGANPGAAGRR